MFKFNCGNIAHHNIYSLQNSQNFNVLTKLKVTLCFVDGAMLTDLCCFWTGSNMLPPRSGKLNVFFDKASPNLMPMAESCFCNLTLPVVHLSFDQFWKQMDNALKYGSKGFTFS